LIVLTKTDILFIWSPSCQKAFETLKQYFTSAPILYHFDPERKIVIEPDAFNLIAVGILSQHNNEGILHLVANFLRNHLPVEINYEISDKELLAVIHVFKEWYPMFEDFPHPIEII
jgi:hypothetical protein